MTTALQRGLSPVRVVLDNGATVIAQHTTTHRAVTVFASLAAGSGHDQPAAPGTAHFVGRTIDRGTNRRSADALAEAFDDRGVSLSVSVTRHLMTFSCTCLADDIAPVLDLLAEVITEPAFPADQVEKRRTAIVTAIGQDADNPAAVATESLMAALYPGGHPYGRPSKGTVGSVQSIGRDTLAGFHRDHFGPSTLRVVIAGDCDVARAVTLAGSAFGRWQARGGPPLAPPPVAPATSRTRRTHVVRGKSQSDIAYGFVSVTRHDPRYYAIAVMNTVLGQYGLGGRLGDNIRERQGMAYYVFSGVDANVAPGPLAVRAGVSPANVERAIAAIDEELSRMARDGVTPAELSDTRRYLIGSLPRTLETNGGIASFLHTADFFGLGLDYDRRLPAIFDAVTMDQVNDAARLLLVPGLATIAVAGPEPEPGGDAAERGA